MAISYPITLPATPGPAQMEWGALTVAGRNVSPYTLSGEAFEWPGNRWRVSVRYPRMNRTEADALIAALVSLYGVGTFLLGPAGPGKTPKGNAGGPPWANPGGQTGKTLKISGLTGILKAGDYFQIGGENRLLSSQAFDNAAWNRTNVTAPAADTIVAPDGTTTAEALVSTAAAAQVFQNLLVPFTPGQKYTFSVWLKAPGGARNHDIVLFDGSSASVACTVCALTTSWQRFSVTFTAGSSVFPQAAIGSPVSGWPNAITIHAWGAQVELGAALGFDYFPTSSIPMASTLRLYQNLTDQTGNPATLDIFPRLRESPLAPAFSGYYLVFQNPAGRFRLAQPNQKWDIDQAYLHGLTFDAEEDL